MRQGEGEKGRREKRFSIFYFLFVIFYFDCGASTNLAQLFPK
jgi:hypothetical protein